MKTSNALRVSRAEFERIEASGALLYFPYTDKRAPATRSANAPAYRATSASPSKAAAEEALNRVMRRNAKWAHKALVAMLKLREEHRNDRRFRLTGEHLNLMVCARVGAPKHHNAMGGFIRGLKARGYIVDVNQKQKIVVVTSHARQTPVYRFAY